MRGPHPASFAFALVASGCAFDARVPEGARITCADDDECPDPTTSCALALGLCLPRDREREPPRVVEPLLTPPRIGAAAAARARFDVSEPLARLEVRVLPDDVVLPVVAADAGGEGDPQLGALAVDVDGGALAPGPHTLLALLVDLAGNEATGFIGNVDVDDRAPDVIPGSVSLELLPPPGRFGATAVLLSGGTARVAFVVDDAEARVVDVTARAPDGALAFARDDASEGTAHVYRHTLGAALPGRYALTAQLVDAVGNVRDVALGVSFDVVAPGPGLCGLDASACVDADGDGFVAPPAADPLLACAEATLDCDDADAAVFVGRVDVPGDGRDDDCDGADAPLDARVVYARADGAAGAAGTPDDPLDARTALALDDAVVLLAAGAHDVTGVTSTSTSIVGGWDPVAWTPGAGRTTLLADGVISAFEPAAVIAHVDVEAECGGFHTLSTLGAPFVVEDVHIRVGTCGTPFRVSGTGAVVVAASVTTTSSGNGSSALLASAPARIVGARLAIAGPGPAGISVSATASAFVHASIVDVAGTTSSGAEAVGAFGPLVVTSSVLAATGGSSSAVFAFADALVAASTLANDGGQGVVRLGPEASVVLAGVAVHGAPALGADPAATLVVVDSVADSGAAADAAAGLDAVAFVTLGEATASSADTRALLDAGAPTTIAADVCGACRGALAPAGALTASPDAQCAAVLGALP